MTSDLRKAHRAKTRRLERRIAEAQEELLALSNRQHALSERETMLRERLGRLTSQREAPIIALCPHCEALHGA
jgi:hypothetical protein